MEDQQKRIKNALDKLLYLPHLREQQHQMGSSPSAISPLRPTTTAKESKGRVWDRSDFFCRLHTFRPATWFCKPPPLSPIECARRGWLNTANDTLSCEFCQAKVIASIPSHLSPSDALSSAQKHAKRLTEAHDTACPWSTACCQLSLLKFPQLSPETVKEDFVARATRLSRVVALPPLDISDYYYSSSMTQQQQQERECSLLFHLITAVKYNNNTTTSSSNDDGDSITTNADKNEYIKAHLQGSGTTSTTTTSNGSAPPPRSTAALQSNTIQFSSRVKAIAICGWDVRPLSTKQQQEKEQGNDEMVPPHLAPESAMLCCDLCGARVGLWTCFPKMQPVVPTTSSSTSMKRTGKPGDGILMNSSNSSNTKTSAPPSALLRSILPSSSSSPSSLLLHGMVNVSQSPGKSAGKNVLANTATTIAGGVLQESSEAAAIMPAFGPFGSKTPSVPLFGAPEGAFLGSGGGGVYKNMMLATTGSDTNITTNTKKRSKRKGNEEEEEEETETDMDLNPAAADNVQQQQPKLMSSTKRPKLAPPPPSTASLQQYKVGNIKCMHPILSHKSFCPWAHTAPQEGGNNNEEEDKEDNCPGWLYCLKTLVHLAMNKNNNKKGDDDDDDLDVDMMGGTGGGQPRFDASALLRDVLRKVDG